MKRTTFGYKQMVTAEMLNERFADLAGGSILNGFRLAKGTGNYTISLRRGNDNPSAAITNDGVRVMETTDVVDAVTIRPNTHVLTRYDVVYVAWRQELDEVTFDYFVVEGVPGLPVNIETNPANRLPLGHVRVRTNASLAEDDLTSLDIGVKFGTLYANGMIINGTPILTKSYVDGEVQKNKDRIVSTETEISAARKSYPTLNDMLVGEMAQKANVIDMEQKFNLIGNASPKGVYATVAALQTAKPTGDANIYVVTADGKWYYWNGTAWTAGGVYQSTGIDDMSKKDIYRGVSAKNLLNVSTITKGFYVTNAGVLTASATLNISDFIPVIPGTSYTFSKTASSSGGIYNANKEWVQSLYTAVGEKVVIKMPTTGYYVRINFDAAAYADVNNYCVNEGTVSLYDYFPKGTSLDWMALTEKNIPPSFITSSMLQAGGVTIDKLNGFKWDNLFDKDTATKGSYIRNTGTISAGATLSYSDYIEVKPNQAYTMSKGATSSGGFYDINKNWIGAIPATPSGGILNYTFTTPANATYVRINNDNFNENLFMLVEGSVMPSTYKAYGGTVKALNNKNTTVSKWYGKTIVTFGDSITWYDGQPFRTTHAESGIVAKGYQSYMREKLGAIVTNKGSSGDTMTDLNNVVKATSFTNVDAVTITAGANDYRRGIAIGTIQPVGSTFDVSTYVGALQDSIERILIAKPEIKIYLLTPIKGWDDVVGVMPTTFPEAMIGVGKLYSLSVCGWYYESGINALTKSTYIGDNPTEVYDLHPTNKGYERMANILIPFLENR